MQKLILILLPIVLIMSCTEPNSKVDLIVKNAKIYTVNQNFQIAECIAVKN